MSWYMYKRGSAIDELQSHYASTSTENVEGVRGAGICRLWETRSIAEAEHVEGEERCNGAPLVKVESILDRWWLQGVIFGFAIRIA